ncbi:MAG TPA: hypothetical protein VGE40_01070 [Bacilli bacterium]
MTTDSYPNHDLQEQMPWKAVLYTYEALSPVEKIVYDYVTRHSTFSHSDIQKIAEINKLDEFQVRAAIILLVLKKMIRRPQRD